MGKSLIYIFLVFFVSILSLIESETTITPIETKLKDGIFKEDASFEEEGDVYFSYEIPTEQVNGDFIFTVRSTGEEDLKIECILSKSTELSTIVNEFTTQPNICQKYPYSNKLYNVISSLTSYELTSKLYIKLHANSTCVISIFVRENGSYFANLNAMQGTDSYTFFAMDFKVNNFLDDFDSLLASSKANSLLIYGLKNDKVTLIDETSAFAISEQSLAAHFWDYDKVTVFVGEKEFKDAEQESNIEVFMQKYADINYKLYYYIPNFDKGFISFHYECTNDAVQHYLLINYGNLDEESTYNYKFHNLIGSKSTSITNLPVGEKDIKSLSFSTVNRFNYLTKTDSNLQVLKLECSKDGAKINANLKYSKMVDSKDLEEMNGIVTKDFVYDFSAQESYTLNYTLDEVKEFTLEAFTPDETETKKLNVEFEGQNYEINNQNAFEFKITDNSIKQLKVSSTDKIKAIISFSPNFKRSDVENKKKALFNVVVNTNLFYTFYEIDHDLNANYFVELSIENPTDKIIPLCHYLTTMAVIQNTGQNCFLIEPNSVRNITLKNIFTANNKGKDFNLEEPKYHLVMYNNRDKVDYKISKINFNTDLEKTTPINTYYEGHEFLFNDAELIKDQPKYFNVPITNEEKEKHFDLYLLNETAGDELAFDVKCIMKSETEIEVLDPYLTEETNICFLLNKDDFKSNVYHFIFNSKKNESDTFLIIKITPKEDLSVKIVINEKEVVLSNYKFSEKINDLDEQSVYKIFEVEKSSLTKNVIFYDNDKNGVELYVRKNNDFVQIKKGSLLIINPTEIFEKYSDYDKLVLVLGKNDCNQVCTTESKYQIKFLDQYSYHIVEEFKRYDDYNHFAVALQKCPSNPYYVIFDYGKLEENIRLGKHVFYGSLSDNNYFDDFNPGDFEQNPQNLDEYEKLAENDLNFNVIKFNCDNKLFAYFDYFNYVTKTNIKLNKGSVHHYLLKENTKYTFNYESIDEIKIDITNGDNVPTITFENNEVTLSEKSISLTVNDKTLTEFTISTPESAGIPLKITTIVNIENLAKTEIEGLHTVDNKYVYHVPTNSSKVSFSISLASRLRLLLEESEEAKICYNDADMIVLDKNDQNCKNVKDNDKLVYNTPEGLDSYVVLYPADDNVKFTVTDVGTSDSDDKEEETTPSEEEQQSEEEEKKEGEEEKKEGEEEEKKEGEEESGEEEKDEGKEEKEEKNKKGTSWVVILIIVIIAVVLLIFLIVCIFVKVKKKQVTSEEIESDVNNTGSIPI